MNSLEGKLTGKKMRLNCGCSIVSKYLGKRSNTHVLLSTFGSEGAKKLRIRVDKRVSTLGWLLTVRIFLLLQLQT